MIKIWAFTQNKKFQLKVIRGKVFVQKQMIPKDIHKILPIV